MFYQKVVDGKLIDYPVLEDQVPTDQADLYHLIDMEAPDYDPHKQSCIDNGVIINEDGVPVRSWTITDTPEIEVNIWSDTMCKANLDLYKATSKTGADWDAWRVEMEAIRDNAQSESPSGTPEDVVWPTPPEPLVSE